MPEIDAPVLVVIAIVVVLIGASLVARRLVRRIVVRIAEMFGLLSIVLGALAGGVSGYAYGRFLRLEFDAVEALPVYGAIVGTIVGFLLPAIAFSVLFLMIEIAENSRRTVAFFQHLQTKAEEE
jgi:hypothetical protein